MRFKIRRVASSHWVVYTKDKWWHHWEADYSTVAAADAYSPTTYAPTRFPTREAAEAHILQSYGAQLLDLETPYND